MCLYIIHFLLAVNYDKKVVQTHFLLLFVNKKYPETYILLWKGGWFWLFTHFANKKPSASPRAFYCCKMCKKSKSPPFLYYKKTFYFLFMKIFQNFISETWHFWKPIKSFQLFKGCILKYSKTETGHILPTAADPTINENHIKIKH